MKKVTEASASVCLLLTTALKTQLWFNVLNLIYVIAFSDALILSTLAVHNVNYTPLEDPYLILKRIVYFNIQSVHHNLAVCPHAVDQQARSRSHAWFGLDIKWSLGGTRWYNMRTCFYCHSTCQHLVEEDNKNRLSIQCWVLTFNGQHWLFQSLTNSNPFTFVWLGWTTVAPSLKGLISLAN